jgi:hypothetical protein
VPKFSLYHCNLTTVFKPKTAKMHQQNRLQDNMYS